MMRCDEVLRLLDDHVDGTLGGDQSEAVADHLVACAGCRRVEAGTRAVLAAAAALPPAVEPARDLWPGIAARLGATVVPLAGARGAGRHRRWASLAAAAALLVAATTVVTVRWVERGAGPTAAPAPAAVPARLAADAALAGALADYRRAAGALRSALEQRRAAMSPADLRVVDENLAVVDAAIGELTRALAAQPGNRELTLLLASTCQTQIELLQTANRLSRS
jgi:hypothetical protein